MKSLPTRVIGIGQPAAGDDNAGIAVVRALREQPLPPGVEIHEVTDPALLIDLLDGIRYAILIDALVSEDNPGNIVFLTPDELATCRAMPLSSHGMSVTDAIELVNTLASNSIPGNIHIIGITIASPGHYRHAMSAAITAAVPRAAGLITQLLENKKFHVVPDTELADSQTG